MSDQPVCGECQLVAVEQGDYLCFGCRNDLDIIMDRCKCAPVWLNSHPRRQIGLNWSPECPVHKRPSNG